MGTLASRRVEAEMLDQMRNDDPEAIASRRDLVWINGLMLQPGILASLLRRHVEGVPGRILEIGAGDGRFMLRVARRMRRVWPKVSLTLLDRAELVSPETIDSFADLGWSVEVVTRDIFDWLAQDRDEPFDVVTANLFLHHFQTAELRRLFAGLQRMAPLFIATEPRRSATAVLACSTLGWLGMNRVTRHDAPASVRAGFRDDELSAIWARSSSGQTIERFAAPFSHVFVGKVATPTGFR